jgi:hypothetical protein
MPTLTLTNDECQQLIQMLVNSNPLIVKVASQIQEQTNGSNPTDRTQPTNLDEGKKP